MPNLIPTSPASEGGPLAAGEHPLDLGGALLCRFAGKHVLVARRPNLVLVNGRPVPAGIRVLAHRDQIHVGMSGWWFSAEDPSHIEPFPGGEVQLCPRCRLKIDKETPSVHCACGAWFHRSERLPCFDYAANCPVCHRETTLSPTSAGLEED